MQNKHYLLAGYLVAAVFIGAGVFLFARKATAPTSSTSTQGSTTVVALGNGAYVQSNGEGTIKVLQPTSTTVVQKPNLDHVVVYASTLSPEATIILKTQIASIREALKKDPALGNEWLQLGIDYKIAGDFTAAADVWTYLTKVSPNNFVVFANLGDLYQNFLRDYPKAEANYLTAVKLSPTTVAMYRNLYTLYRYQYKTNTTAAADIVAKGLLANPGNSDLLELQKQLDK